MGSALRRKANDMRVPEQISAQAAEFWRELKERPHAYDLFAVLRRIESLYPDRPRMGRSQRLQQDPVRLGQVPSTAFAPATLAQVDTSQEMPRLRIFSFGLFGPNGPLPLGMTEYALERLHHHDDGTLSSFADLFHHRLIQLFYRAWASAQSTVSLDRENDDFTRYLASLVHHGLPSQRKRDSVPDQVRWGHAGHLVRQVRNAEGLERVLHNFFQVPVRVEEFIKRWLPLPEEERTQLSRQGNSQLGVNAVAGRAVLDRQYSLRLHLGPMSLKDYERFLPAGAYYVQLMDWIRTYVGVEYVWDVRLQLRSSEVPRTSLGSKTQLGLTSWLDDRHAQLDRSDLLLNPPKRIAS